jgi:hypothetical protein
MACIGLIAADHPINRKADHMLIADDVVMGFETKADADQLREGLAERMRELNLELHSGTTQLLEFGPFPVQNRRQRGERTPEQFDKPPCSPAGEAVLDASSPTVGELKRHYQSHGYKSSGMPHSQRAAEQSIAFVRDSGIVWQQIVLHSS